MVLVLQEVQGLLSLLWSHCIHLGLENQYFHLDLGDPDTRAHVISLTSDPLLAALRNILLALLPCLENLERQHFPEIRKSHIFPSEACDWLVNHYTSSSGAIKQNQNQTYLPDLLCVQQLLPGPHPPFGPFLPRAPEGLENQEALVDPAIPENQEVPSVKKNIIRS